MGDRTVSKIVRQVATAAWTHMQPLCLPEPTHNQWEKVASDFERRWHFPNCLGVVDGKHVCIKKPSYTGSSFYNYKYHFSVVLMATVDSNYNFNTIDMGSMGRFSDGHVFSNSALGKKLHSKSLNIPKPKSLESAQGDNVPCRKCL